MFNNFIFEVVPFMGYVEKYHTARQATDDNTVRRRKDANIYTGCHRRNGPNFGRVFLMLNYTDVTQNTYIQS